MGWNPQGGLDFTGITETRAESGVHKEGLVTTQSPHTNMNRDSRVRSTQGGTCHNTKLPYQDGQRQRGGGHNCHDGGRLV